MDQKTGGKEEIMKRNQIGTRRFAALLLALAMVFSLAACGEPQNPNVSGSQPGPGTSSTPGTPDNPNTPSTPDTPDQPNPSNPSAGVTETTISANGTETGILSANGKFYPDFASYEIEQQAAAELNVQLAEEGNVLVKNDGALPLGSDDRYVTLFGSASVNIIAGGTGSGSGSGSQYSLEQSFADAGFVVNKQLLDFYSANPNRQAVSSGDMGVGYQNVEIDPAIYPERITSTYSMFGDVAVLTLARVGGEGADLSTHDLATHADPTDHYLQLDDNERKLLAHIKEQKAAGVFGKIVVIINSANAMELGELNDDTDINAILWIGQPGANGLKSIGRILSGEVNPSGRLVDTYVRDLKQDPTWTNFGNNGHIKDANGESENIYFYRSENGELVQVPIPSLEYREGIYVGYRWYETVADTMNASAAGSGDSWYENSVVYPFGYGLSYTTFDWTMDSGVAPTGTVSAANGTITVKVNVRNTGCVAGKDVVQVYYTAPYTDGGIEKSTVNLVGFAKTRLLQPGESQTVTIQFVAQDMASYDWNDANGNGFKGYELEAGDYIISVRRNAHEVVDSITRTVASTIQCSTDLTSGLEIKNLFSGENGLEEYITVNDSLLSNSVSRTNLQQPATASKTDRVISDEYYSQITRNAMTYFSYQDQPTDPWYVSGTPAGWTQALQHAEDFSDVTLKLADMAGVSYAEPAKDGNGNVTSGSDEGSQKWEQFMNQLTFDELVSIVTNGGYQTVAVPSIGKAGAKDQDGPGQLANGTFWVCETVIAATWNQELAYKQGRMIGNESLFQNVSGWYGPGMNLHRSAFGGRNFEYYSEDGVLSGIIAAQVTLGATDKGTNVYIKHMVLNDQETHRGQYGGVRTWVTEQALREIYLKPFEYAVKFGKATGMMSSCSAIGASTGTTNYAMQEALMRGEWGFKGATVSDFYHENDYRPINLLIRTGQELPLGNLAPQNVEGVWDASANGGKGGVLVRADADSSDCTVLSPTQYFALRNCAQRILYVAANVSTNRNGLSDEIFANLRAEIIGGLEGMSAQITADADAHLTFTSDSVPEGFAMTPDGVLSHPEPLTVGRTYTFDVTAEADGYLTYDGTVTVQVVGAIRYTGTPLDAFSGEVSGQLSSDLYAPGVTLGSGYAAATITEVTYEVVGGSLPAGVTLAPDGTLSGTASGSGTATIRLTYSAKPMWGPARTGTYDQEFTFRA